MYGENYEGVPRDVPQDSLENADRGDIGQPVGENEGGYKARDAEDGAGDKNRKAFAQVVVHDAEIRIWDFNECVGNKRDDGGCGKNQVAFCIATFPFQESLAHPSIRKKE